MVSQGEAASALGVAAVRPGIERQAKLGPASGAFCTYSVSADSPLPMVQLAAYALGSGGRALFQRYKAEQCSSGDCRDVKGVGEDAYVTNDALAVLSGTHGVIAAVRLKSGDVLAELAADKRLAAMMLSRL